MTRGGAAAPQQKKKKKTYIGLHVNPLFLSDFKVTRISLAYFGERKRDRDKEREWERERKNSNT